ncbi:MAG: PIN domain-containing protein [Phycisphaerae bacterium]
MFTDTNIRLDVLAQREPLYAASARVWTLAETGQITGFASALSLPNLFDLLRRGKEQKAARQTMSLLRDIFYLVPLDGQITQQAMDAEIDDFEEAIGFCSALRVRAAVIITRKPRNFSQQNVAIQTPAEFLGTHFPG